jgi:hypothetical protein
MTDFFNFILVPRNRKFGMQMIQMAAFGLRMSWKAKSWQSIRSPQTPEF